MAELICDTSVVTALHEVRLLKIFPLLGSKIILPAAVERELEAGRSSGYDLPDVASIDWIAVRTPIDTRELPNAKQLGDGESNVLWLALEIPNSVAVLDDGAARRTAIQLGIRFTGTLGLLLDVKQKSLIEKVAPVLDELIHHDFNMSPSVRANILKAAGEVD